MTSNLTPVEEYIHQYRMITTADGQCIIAELGYGQETSQDLLQDGEEIEVALIEMSEAGWNRLPECET